MLGCWSDSSSFNRFEEKKIVIANKKETQCYTDRVRELQTWGRWLMPAHFAGGRLRGSKWSIRALLLTTIKSQGAYEKWSTLPLSVSWLLTHTNVHQVTKASYNHSDPRNLPFLFEKRPINYNEWCQVSWHSPAIRLVTERHDSLKVSAKQDGNVFKSHIHWYKYPANTSKLTCQKHTSIFLALNPHPNCLLCLTLLHLLPERHSPTLLALNSHSWLLSLTLLIPYLSVLMCLPSFQLSKSPMVYFQEYLSDCFSHRYSHSFLPGPPPSPFLSFPGIL